MIAIIIPIVEAKSMKIRLPQNDFDAPDELVAPAPYSSASTKPTGATPPSRLLIRRFGMLRKPGHSSAKSIHQQNLNILRRVDGNPSVYDQDTENWRIEDGNEAKINNL